MINTACENMRSAKASVAENVFVVRNLKQAAEGPAFVLKPEQGSPVVKKVIRRSRPASFERQFLSEKCPEGNGVVEVAVLWRGNVISMNSFTSINDVVTIGRGNGSKNKVNIGVEDDRVGSRKTLLSSYEGRWYLHFERSYEGFLIVDPAKFGVEKVMFSECGPGSLSGIRAVPNHGETLSVAIDGMTRAAIRFGEMLILVRMAKPISEMKSPELRLNAGLASGLAVSVLIHIVVFSMMLFATDRADAINIDRILTSARFSEVLVQPVETEGVRTLEIEADRDIEVEEPQSVKVTREGVLADVSGVSEATKPGRGSRTDSGETSVLSSSMDAVNSMFASAISVDQMELDWSAFDGELAASERSYGLGMRGTGNFGGISRGDAWSVTSEKMSRIRRTVYYQDLMTSAARISAAAGSKSETEVDVRTVRRANIVGSLDSRLIYKVVYQHRGELKACYERGLSRDRSLSGEIVMRWMVNPDGTVSYVSVASSAMNDQSVEGCITNSISRWRFPVVQTDVSTMITYPFVFEAR